jgi:N-acetylmuramoyl-L-alanine amidase
MAYSFHRRICPEGLKNNPNSLMSKIMYITIHTTGNYKAEADAESHANYQLNGSGGRQTSWHYSVDCESIWQSFEDNSACWHAGDGNGEGNMNSIGIEICVNNKERFSETCANAAELAASLLSRYNLSIEQVVQHNHWSGKDCPKELRTGIWGIAWKDFIGQIEAALTFLRGSGKTITVSDWAKEAWEWGINNQVIDSFSPKSYMTKEQVITCVYKAHKAINA